MVCWTSIPQVLALGYSEDSVVALSGAFDRVAVDLEWVSAMDAERWTSRSHARPADLHAVATAEGDWFSLAGVLVSAQSAEIHGPVLQLHYSLIVEHLDPQSSRRIARSNAGRARLPITMIVRLPREPFLGDLSSQAPLPEPCPSGPDPRS